MSYKLIYTCLGEPPCRWHWRIALNLCIADLGW